MEGQERLSGGERPRKKAGKAEKQPKFRFVEKASDSASIERPLVPLQEPTFVEPGSLARSFIAALDADRGRSRVSEASFQNRITRAICQRSVANPRGLYVEFVRSCQNMGRQVSKEAERAFKGIEANLWAIEKMKGEFESEKKEGDAQIIAMNDTLDAENMIDLIELRGSVASGTIDKVRLVQVKRSEMTQTEIRNIHAEHEKYVHGLATVDDQEHDRRLEEADKALGAAERFEALFGEAVPDEDLPAALEAYTEQALLELLAGDIRDLKDQEIDAIVARAADKVDPALFKLILAKDKSGVLLKKFATQIFGEQEGFDANGTLLRLQRWVAENPVTRQELEAVTPGYTGSDACRKVRVFYSVVYHGDKVSTKMIPVAEGEDKGLTYH